MALYCYSTQETCIPDILAKAFLLEWQLLALQTVADSKKTVSDDDILALLGDEANQIADLWALKDLQVSLLSRLDTDALYQSSLQRAVFLLACFCGQFGRRPHPFAR